MFLSYLFVLLSFFIPFKLFIFFEEKYLSFEMFASRDGNSLDQARFWKA